MRPVADVDEGLETTGGADGVSAARSAVLGCLIFPEV
jgi:hypothetical protein